MGQQVDLVANLLLKVDNAESGINKLKSSLSQLKLPANLENSFKKSFGNLDSILDKYRSQLEKGFNTKADVTNFAKAGRELESELNKMQSNLTKLTGKQIDFKVNSSELVNAEKILTEVVAKKEQLTKDTLKLNITGGSQGAKDVETLLNQLQSIAQTSTKAGQNANNALAAIQMGNIKEALQALRELDTTYRNLGKGKKDLFEEKTGMTMKNAIVAIIAAVSQMEGKFKDADGAIKTAANEVANIQASQVERAGDAASKAAVGFDNTASSARKANNEAQNFANSMYSAKSQVEQLQHSTQYFFSLRNMINLLRRGIQDAIGTVKDLDKAMTETAVVTKFSVGDMWEKLPEYTANANALGATVQDMYEATTLYYQQGLNAQQAMGVANETMKMARIGGLEATVATDMMTAALRGFNMEINEMSAQRINDVYSNLAAKTASNTKELGTAMQRTASIAASAGMSFEGTAAFLAQAIETTREPAENLGTAMKTIVARFTELKKNPLEISEVDGEVVDYNKVDTALQSIGVSLKDANGQFRDLDKVFLDISQRWDSLTQTQQRYVATTAAGSRQQSRFIAMMSNYERTVQLMDYATNSEGASAAQFDKTLESLEAKINKFRNAWNQFLMGIMDNSWIKGLVDGTTKVVGAVNSLINVLSGGGKLKGVKSFLSLFTAFTGLKLAGRGINRLVGGLGGFVDPTSSFRKGFWGAIPMSNPNLAGGTQAPRGLAGQISNPIVAKLNELIAVTRTASGQQIESKAAATSTVEQYKSAIASLRNIRSTTFGSIEKTFDSLSDEHAYAAFRNTPGTVDAIKESTLKWLKNKQLPNEAQNTGELLMNSIFRGMQRKEIPIKEGIKLLGKPELWGKYFGTDVAEAFSKTFADTQQAMRRSKLASQKASALEEAWQKAGGHETYDDVDKIRQYLKDNKGSDFVKKVLANYKDIRKAQREADGADLIKNAPVVQNNLQQLANQAGIIGSKFTSAGFSLQMFGSQLAQLSPALQGVGTLVAEVGMAISTFGMGLTAVGAKVLTFGGMLATAYKVASNMAAGIGGALGAKLFVGSFFKSVINQVGIAKFGLALGAVLIGGIILAKKHAEKKAKEAGEEVRKNFEKGFTENDKKLTTITNSKDRFNKLAEGVDEFGHNINLTNEEYDEYLNLSKELAEASPSLIAGYNAEGQAILKKGEALDAVIEKLKEYKQEALEAYTSNDAVDKLIKEYKTSDAFKDYGYDSRVSYYGGNRTAGFSNKKLDLANANAKIKSDFDIKDAIAQLSGWEISSLSALTTEQLSWVSQHYSDIINLVSENNKGLEKEVQDGLKEAFGNINSSIDEVMTAGQPIVDDMQHWMGLEKLDAVGIGLGEEFGTGFNEGFDAIMLRGLTEGWSSERFKSELQDYSDGWKQLGGATSEYSDILAEADDIQQEYLDHIGENGSVEEYKDNVEGLALQLEDLAGKYKDTGAAGQAFAEQCIQQANALRNYTEEGVSLAEGLNHLSDEIGAAESVLEDFNEATKKDFWSIAEDMKTIYDKAFETFKDSYGTEREKHFEGHGDKTVWEAGKALFGEDALKGLDKDQLRKKFKEWEPVLREGREGWDEFWKKVTGDEQIQKNLKELEQFGVKTDENGFLSHIPDEQWGRVADALGISEELLTSMVNKGRQFATISLANWNQVRQSLENSEATIEGKSSTKGKKALYIKESTFEAALADAGYSPQEYQAQKDAATKKQNINFIKAADEYKKGSSDLVKAFEDMGVKTLPQLIETLNQTGDFTKDEIENYADKLGYLDDVNFDEVFNSIVGALENPAVAEQTKELIQLHGTVKSILDEISGNNDPDQALDKLKKSEEDNFGEDSAIHNFGLNRIWDDELGKYRSLTEEEYEAQDKYANDLQKSYEQAAADAQAKADAAFDSTEREHWQEVADEANRLAGLVKSEKELGEKLHKSREEWARVEEENAEKADKLQKDANKRAEKYYKENEYGNADKVKRKEIDWGENPTQNKNYAAAQSWGLTETDLQNYSSSYMSQVMTAGEGSNAVALTISPVVQIDGKATMLNKDIVQQYVDKLTEGATDKNGKIDVSKLIELDQEGLEIEGQKISNLLMGAFTGEGKEEAAKALKGIEKETANSIKRLKRLEDSTKKNAPKPETDTGTGGEKPKQEPPKPAEPPKSTPSFESPAFAYTEEHDIEYTLHTNDEEVTKSQEKVDNLSIAMSSPFAIYLRANYPEVAKALGLVEDVQSTSAKGSDLEARANYSQVTAAKSQISSIAGHAFSAALTVSTGGALGALQKIWDLIQKIKNNNPGGGSGGTKFVGGGGGHFKKDAAGQNNHGIASIPVIGSAARGGYGRLGPKGKGGPTLTGELGYEIAWLPDENRSLILGANGPQMIDLPGNAVVWTHEQSKKIMRQKAIPAGSHADIDYDTTDSPYINISPKKKPPKKAKKNDGKDNKQHSKNIKKTTELIKKTGKVSAWWWNMGKKVEATQRTIDKTYKKIEKLMDKAGTTIDTLSKDGNLYIKKLNKQIQLNTSMLARAENNLRTLDRGVIKNSAKDKKIKKAKNKVNDAKAYLKEVQKSGSKKEIKAAKKALKSAKKKLKKAQTGANFATVSYDATQVTTKKKGKKVIKKTKKKVTKKDRVDLSKFVKYDSSTGTYIVDTDAINNKKWDKGKKKAVMEAAQKKIDDYQKKRDEAQDNIDEAQEALEELSEKLYENFHAWENELTEIYFLTQKIAEVEERISAMKSLQTLQDNRLLSGLSKLTESFKQTSLQYFKLATKGAVSNINNRNELIGLKKSELIDTLKGSVLIDEKQQLFDQYYASTDATDQARILGAIKAVNDDLTAVKKAQEFITPLLNSDGTIDLQFNTQAFKNAKDSGQIGAAEAEKIQNYIKKIEEGNQELISLYEEQISGLNELYETLTSLQEQYADYAEELLSAIEQEAEERLDKMNKLSDAVSNSFKELIDKVKEQLEQRRQEEDNAKTERDIVKKQNRLALLRANASGGNVVAAAQLEQEIADAQQSYGRTLEDQLLDRLQNSSDKAEKQREQQIKILEAQLELNKINGVNVGEVNKYLSDPDRYQSRIIELIKYEKEYDAATDARRVVLDGQINEILAGLDKETGIPAKIRDVTNAIGDAELSLADSIETLVDGIKQALENNGDDINVDVPENTSDLPTVTLQLSTTDSKTGKANTITVSADKKTQAQSFVTYANARDTAGKISALQVTTALDKGKAAGLSEKEILVALARTKGLSWKKIVIALKSAGIKKSDIKGWMQGYSSETLDKVLADWSKYASGGLNTSTGPAWLDGTPSKPELVLNSTDTKNFLVLKDVLSKVMNGKVLGNSENYGDILYEININVDRIEKDYDVDQVVDKVKKEIVKSAGYRNVTQVRNLR